MRAFTSGVVNLQGVPRRQQGGAIDVEIERCLETIIEDATLAHPDRAWTANLVSVHYGEMASRGYLVVTVVADVEPTPLESFVPVVRPASGSAAEPGPSGRTACQEGRAMPTHGSPAQRGES